MQWAPATVSPLHVGGGSARGRSRPKVQQAPRTQPAFTSVEDGFTDGATQRQQPQPQTQQQQPRVSDATRRSLLPQEVQAAASGDGSAPSQLPEVAETYEAAPSSLWSTNGHSSSMLDFLGSGDLGPLGLDSDGARTSIVGPSVLTKHLVLIRHGRSSWNEFLIAQGVSRLSTLGKAKRQSPDPVGAGPDLGDAGKPDPKKPTGFWKGVRKGVKHVAHATASVISHSDTLSQVDHGLAVSGMRQVRQLRKSISALMDGGPAAEGSAAALLLSCELWYVSPFLRCLQTAAYALSPLRCRGQPLNAVVTPLANEIVSSQMSLDCQGKKGNVGIRVLTRALAKVAEAIEEEEDFAESAEFTLERQAELAEVSSTLCAMDLTEVNRTWWKDVGSWKKEHLDEEDRRIRYLISRMLLAPGPVAGLVAHSLLFRRIIQLFWPKDPAAQEAVRIGLRNGAPPDTPDPVMDKVMNCGTLVLTVAYKLPQDSARIVKRAEIVGAEFLFEGKMEGALSGEQQTVEVLHDDELPMPDEFLDDSPAGSPPYPP